MKKIWPWLFLLLLLIIFCVWSKKDSIHLTKDANTQHVVTPTAVEEVRYIEYALIQNNANHYTLNGKFATTQQEERFKEVLSKSRKNLTIAHTSTNETLQGAPAIELTSKILPHFSQHYSKGKIVYHNQKLTILGIVDGYEAQHEMQRLLNTSKLASSDESTVISNRPIEYTIHKDQQKIHAEGIFNDARQMNQIKRYLPANATTDFKIEAHHKDAGSLRTLEAFLPTFFSKYTKGDIVYNKEKLTITGNVRSKAELNRVNTMLSHASIPIINHTIIDPGILKREAKERARQAALAKEEKARQAALSLQKKQKEVTTPEVTKLADKATKAAQDRVSQAALREAKLKAEAEASEKARREAYKARAEAKLAEEKRRAEANRLAEEKKRAEAAKEAEMKIKISNLFKLENIEFNVNKSTLTEKGQNTVNKLARILKEYPSVRIEIAGHTDSDGSAEYNQKLSQSRVDTVRTKLIAQAIKSTRLVAKGYGEAQPLVPNNSRANKAKNRRVEINILGE